VSVATNFRNAAVKNKSHRCGMAQFVTVNMCLQMTDCHRHQQFLASQSVSTVTSTLITKLMLNESSLSGISMIGAIMDFHCLGRLGASNRHPLIILFHPQYLSTNHLHTDCYSFLKLHLLAHLLQECEPSRTKTKTYKI
jgi:hypothetical protein